MQGAASPLNSGAGQHPEDGMDLNQITIPCRNYEKSVEFYKRLGLQQIVESPPCYARFESASGTTLSIHKTESAPLASEVVIYFEVENVDTTVSRLRGQRSEL